MQSEPPKYCYSGFGLFRVRSPLLAESQLISLPPGTQMFQFPRFPTYSYLIHCMFHDSSSWVFPHSEICGSKLICSSPQLIAACHVLRRLPMPRHSPYALLRLNYFLYIWRYTIGSRFSRLNCCVSYLQFKTFYRLWQNCFLLPFTEKPDFILQILLCGL